MRVYLIGFMGSGKSHTGAVLAKKMQVPFFDLDDEIEKIQKATINDIFAENGEAYFRNLEHNVLHVVTENNADFVMSCGGGAPCFYDNMDYMKAQGKTVWLDTPPEILLGRLRRQQLHRPLLRGLDDAGLKNYITLKNEERKKYYSMAGIHIQDSAAPVNDIINALNNE